VTVAIGTLPAWTTSATSRIPSGDAPVIEVRVAGPDDWPLWRRLRRAALAEAPDAFRSTLAQWSGDGDTEQRWRDRIDAVALNLVLYLDGQPVGMVSATDPARGADVELISLWIAPEARGRFVGDAAIEGVIAWADEHHPGRSIRLVVKQGNRPALTLYRRHGFANAALPAVDDEIVLVRRHQD
jgi:ribosomal protein S18 acetylase RimI-like enzyme